MRRLHDQPHVRGVWETHYVTPLAHFRNMPGQQLPCGPVSDDGSYYYLEALPREGGAAVTFFAENHCAEKILRGFGRPLLPIFDPFVRSRAARRAPVDPRSDMIGLNADLYDAIHMLCLAFGFMPKNGISRTLESLRTEPDRKVERHEIVRFAQALARYENLNPLSLAIDSLRRANARLREFPFIFLRARLRHEHLPDCL